MVEAADVERIEIKNMTPELFKFHGKKAYESYDVQKSEEFQFDMH